MVMPTSIERYTRQMEKRLAKPRLVQVPIEEDELTKQFRKLLETHFAEQPDVPFRLPTEVVTQYGFELEQGYEIEARLEEDAYKFYQVPTEETRLKYETAQREYEEWKQKITATGWAVTDEGFLKSPEGELWTPEELEVKRQADLKEFKEVALPKLPEELQAKWETPDFWAAYEEYAEPRIERWQQTVKAFSAIFPEVEEVDVAQRLAQMEIREGATFEEIDAALAAQDEFLGRIAAVGRTDETERLLQGIGFDVSQIDDFFAEPTPPATEVRILPSEGKSKDVLDAARLALAELGHSAKRFFISTLPNILFRSPTEWERKIQGDEWADETERINKERRDLFRGVVAREELEHQDWLDKHPDLQPRPEWAEGITKHPSLIKDPWYWAYEFSSSAPFTIAAMAATIGVTAVAGPVAGIAAGIAVMTPAQASDMERLMLQYGAPEDKAAGIGLTVGTAMSLIEVAGDLPMFKMIAPKLFGTFKKNVTEEIARRTMGSLLKKGVKTFTAVEVTESLEEVAQQAVQNAALKTVKENQSVFEGLTETAVRTAIATAPFGLAGVGAVARPEIRQAFGEAIEQYRIAPERGAIGGEFISGKKWDGMSVPQRSELAKAAGIEKDIYTMTWAELTLPEKQALARQPIPTVTAKLPTGALIPSENLNAKSPVLQGTINSLPANLKAISDFSKSAPFSQQGLSGFNVPSQGAVINRVVAMLHQPEIRETIVKTIPVDVVDKLISVQLPTKIILHNPSVNQETLAVLPDGSISLRVDTADSLVRVIAGLTTEKQFRTAQMVRATIEGLPAIRAIDIWHNLSIAQTEAKVKGEVEPPTPEAGMPEAGVTQIEAELGRQFPNYEYIQFFGEEGVRYTGEAQDKITGQRITVKGTTRAEVEQLLRAELSKAVTPPAEVAPSPLLNVPEGTVLPMPDEVTVSEDRVIRPPPPPEVPPPHEPPTIHPPQPAPIEDNRLVMPDLQPAQQVVDVYSRPDFWRNVANLPLVKKVVGLFDPWAIANKPADQAVALRAALKDEAAQKAQAVMSHVWEIGTQDRVWGKTDEMGLLLNDPFTGISIDDIRTNPSKFSAQMTAQQKEWIKRADEIERAKLDALKRNDVEINELSFEDGGRYAGRRVMGKFNDSGELIESGRIGIGGRVGAKMPFEKTRVFKNVDDGIRAGYRYMNSDEALYYNTLGAYYKMADKQMAEWVLTKVDWRTTAAPESLVLQAESARIRLRKAQQLLGALNRAVRGERVPSNTINSIASVYVDQADTLKTLIPELQKPSPETADTVRILDAEAKALISEAKVEYYQAVDKRARAREEAQRVKYEEASIAHPAFQGKIFTGEEAKEIADILRTGLQPQFIEALGAVNKVNAIGRFFMLAGDASPMAIQLQFLAFYRPIAYAKAWGGFVRAMFDPEFQYRYYANNRDLINRHPTLILSGRGTEFTEFMGRGGLGQKLGVLAKPLVPFQKAFEGCLDVAGIELAKSLDHRATNPQTTMEVDQFINEFRGLTSSARIGVSSTQRQAETAFLLAPRYNRAIAGYLFDIVHGGVRGSLARMSLTQGFAGLAAMAVAVSIALGEDDDKIWQHFDPTSNKFFTWDVMGVKVGLGGKVRSIIKTFGNMLRNGEVGQPALNFLRGNLSPGASTSLDLISGKNYIGEPTRDNVLDFTKTVGRNFMMIWTQNFLLEGGTLQDKAIIATAEFLGLRGYDISAKKELKIKDLEEMLGQQVGKTPVLTKKKPDIYQGNNIYSDIKRQLQNLTPEEVLADKGYAPLGHAVVRIEQSEGNSLPDIRLQDYNFDKTKGDTLSDYMSQWAERQRIIETGERATYTRVKIVEGKEERTEFKGLAALNAHKQDYPNAERGNITRRQRELLLGYNAAVDKKQFIKDNPDISINPQTAWFKSHPRENAEFAMFGQADIYSKEAYNEFNKLLKEWDWPDAAIPPQTLPPETSVETHFTYLDMVSDGTHGSVQAKLLLLKDYLDAQKAGVQSYCDWRLEEGNKLAIPDETLEYYQMRVDNDELYKKMDAISADETMTDKEKAEARAELRATKVGDETFGDIERRVDAMGKGTRESPMPPEIVDAHVTYMRIKDQTDTYAEGAEANLFLIDNPEYYQSRLNKDLWGSDVISAIDLSQEPKWRLQVQYRPQFTEYDTGIPTKYKTMTDAKVMAIPAPEGVNLDWWARQTVTEKRDYLIALDRNTMLSGNEAFRMDKRRVEAYEKKIPQYTEEWVEFNGLPLSGYRRARYLIEHGGQDSKNLTGFALAYSQLDKGHDIPRPEEVPDIKYDDITEQYQETFDLKDSYEDNSSVNYIADDRERQKAYDALRFTPDPRYTNGILNDFGVAEVRRDGYKLSVPEKFIDRYVSWVTINKQGIPTDWAKDENRNFLTWYEDDWYLIEHPAFYEEIYVTHFELKDYLNEKDKDGVPYKDKVPSRGVWHFYISFYLPASTNEKKDVRWKNRDLDRWGQKAFGWTPIEEVLRPKGLTPAERAEKRTREMEKRIPKPKLKELP